MIEDIGASHYNHISSYIEINVLKTKPKIELINEQKLNKS